ncbi:MAG: type II secretion system F family protein [Pseudonocardia sp.]
MDDVTATVITAATASAGRPVAALLGGGVGLGLFLVYLGLRPVDPDDPSRRRPWGIPPRFGLAKPDRRRLFARVGVAVAAGVVAGVLTGWVVGAVLAGLACWALPGILGPDRGRAERLNRIEAVATWTEMVRDTLSAAAGLEQAVLATARLAPAAIRPEITELAARIRGGDRLVPALRALAARLADPTADLVVAALVMAAEQRARQLADLLGSLAQAAREQVSMRLRVEAGRARSRTSVRVIVGTTVSFAVGMVVLNRPYMAAYDSPTGQVVLLAVGALFTLGLGWLQRISTIDEPARLLTMDGEHAGRSAP